ncbi:MAG: glycogen debranching enzyme family protein [Chloroflexi bacterium]|nr:glycogen debranching enzyme family protein [Chloroflexota bacterium]
MSSRPVLHLARPALLEFDSALRFEWLVTNGLGGYASGTVLGVDTRRYHGLLMAALQPPVGRTLLLARLHVELRAGDDHYALHTAEYHDGTVAPAGYLFLEAFLLDGTLPVWRYRCRDVEIEKTLWLEHGRNTVFIRYRLLAARGRVHLHLEPFVTHRDYHAQTHGHPDWRFKVERRADAYRVEAYPGATPLWLGLAGGRFVETGLWYWRFLRRCERKRGLDDLEDLYTPGIFDVELAPGEAATLVATTHEEDLALDPDASHVRERARQDALLERAPALADDAIRQRLVLAADQFLVCRAPRADEQAPGRTIVAGYHWFSDWGRDTMIALSGLCLATGRADDARIILRTFAGYLDRGLLPNRFPDAGETPEYNTVDATLWLFEALNRYERATGDRSLVDDLLPALCDVVAWHERGTRHGIAVDPNDGLLYAGAPGLQFTWMDAKVGDWVVTPRCGKPVEVQALWFNALCLLAGWLADRGKDAADLATAAARCQVGFNRRFWDPVRGYCADVVDGPAGDDWALRPNQLLAAGLSHPVLDPGHWQPMLGVVERALLTPVGLRSLAPDDPAYVGQYGGDQHSRDAAYHQGTVWAWLVGPFVDVARRVRGETWDARPVLAGLVRHLGEAGLGQVSEIFGGDPPHRASGCIAQAWSVAELLRVWDGPSALQHLAESGFGGKQNDG